MEAIIRQELEHQELELNSKANQGAWRRLNPFQGTTLEERNRQQCVKELEKVLLGRQQLDRTTKNNYSVRFWISENASQNTVGCLDPFCS